MTQASGSVAVDTGLFLIIDPVHLFSRSEWDEINRDARLYGGSDDAVFIKAISKKFAVRPTAFCLVSEFGGDGTFPVEAEDDEVVIRVDKPTG